MDIVQLLSEEVKSFFGIGSLIDMYKSGDYSKLLSLKGILGALGPVIPLILIIEVIRALFYKRFKVEDYRISFFIFVFNRFVSRFLSIAAVAFCIGLFEKYAIINTSFKWYWLIYGYVIWEFAHFIYHYLGHKVRLFWCLHSTHHAPQTMNLFVTFSHFFCLKPRMRIL